MWQVYCVTVNGQMQFEMEPSRPSSIGPVEITYAPTSQLLTPASGFMADYDFTLNPYSGCSFGCTYCYAAFFARDQKLQDTWGQWVKVKENAVASLRRRRKSLAGRSIYMSSVTDPYQPIERHLGLVRGILEILLEDQPRLVVQTRSPLVTRDLDLFSELKDVRINMTVTTDQDRVRRAFEPAAPSTALRLKAIAEVVTAGVPSTITMTPLLPIADPISFSDDLLATGVTNFVIQDFHATRGQFVAGTGAQAKALLDELSWDHASYNNAMAVLRERLPCLIEGREGFAP